MGPANSPVLLDVVSLSLSVSQAWRTQRGSQSPRGWQSHWVEGTDPPPHTHLHTHDTHKHAYAHITHVCVYTRACMHTYTHIHAHTHIHTHAHSTHGHVHACSHIHTHAHLHTHTPTHTHTHPCHPSPSPISPRCECVQPWGCRWATALPALTSVCRCHRDGWAWAGTGLRRPHGRGLPC